MAYLQARHPHLAEMVEAGLPVDEGFRRAIAERRSQVRRNRPRPDVPTPRQNVPRGARGDQTGATGYVFQAARRGWVRNDPIGLDPQTIIDQQRPGGAFYGPVGAIGQTLFVPMIAAGDAVLRGVNAAVHGGAAAAGQVAQELGQSQGMGRRLERDILMMPEALAGSVGRLPSALDVGRLAADRAITQIEHAKRVARREVLHPGWRSFVRARDGSFNFGSLDMDDGLGPVPIRIRRGHNDETTNKGIGLKHVEYRHGRQIRSIVDASGSPRFKSVPDYVDFVANNWTEIRDNGKGHPVLVVRDFARRASDHSQQSLIVELGKAREGDFYDLKTAGPFRNRHLNKLRLIKER